MPCRSICGCFMPAVKRKRGESREHKRTCTSNNINNNSRPRRNDSPLGLPSARPPVTLRTNRLRLRLPHSKLLGWIRAPVTTRLILRILPSEEILQQLRRPPVARSPLPGAANQGGDLHGSIQVPTVRVSWTALPKTYLCTKTRKAVTVRTMA